MREKISKEKMKKISIGAIILLVALISIISIITIVKNPMKEITNLESEIARAMTYDEVQSGDEKTETPYVEFNCYFLRDLDNDGVAEKIKGTCKELNQIDTLYMDINVLTNGYLENGEIEIQGQNFKLKTEIAKDTVVSDNYVSKDTKIIKLNTINNGTQKLLMGDIYADLHNNINNYTCENNKIVLTGTHVADDGTRTEINKEINLTVDWYGNIETVINTNDSSNNIRYIEDGLDQANGNVNLQFFIEPAEVKEELILKSNTVTATIPDLNGYKPTKVEVSGYYQSEKISSTYDETTNELTITKEVGINESTGEITSRVDNTVKYFTYNGNYKSYRSNRYTIKVTYPYEAYETLSQNSVSLSIPVTAVYTGYNNTNSEFENPIESNIATATYTITWRKGVLRYYASIMSQEDATRISKKLPLKIYRGEDIGKEEDLYIVGWRIATSTNEADAETMLQIKETKGDMFFTSDGSYIDMSDYTTNKGMYFVRTDNDIIQEDGYINIYNDETNELIHTFTKQELNLYTETNPYIYGNNIKQVRIEISNVNNNKSLNVYHIKEIDDNALTKAFTKTEFDELEKIYTYMQVNTKKADNSWINTGTDSNDALYVTPGSFLFFGIDKQEFSTQVTEKNVNIFVSTSLEDYYDELYTDKWKNGEFLIKFPKEVLNVEINNISISNEDVNIAKYEILEKDNCKWIKIVTENDTPQDYEITIDSDITSDPRILSSNSYVEIYAYNPEVEGYNEEAKDIYDINNNGNTDENVFYTKEVMCFLSPTSLVTSEEITNYDSNGSFVVSPQVADIDINEAQNATVKLNLTNNYSGTISEIVVVGKIPFEGNKYQLNEDKELGSTLTTSITGPIVIPDSLSSKVTVYYSENETITKDITNSSNNLKTESEVTDWSKIKTYAIDFGETKLNVNEKYNFTYQIKLPETLTYNQVAYSTHAVYFALDTENGKLYTQTETGKVGIRIAKKFDLNILKTKLGKTTAVQGATFSITPEGQEEGKIGITNSEGKIQIKGLYVNETYTLKETKQAEGYSQSNIEVKFRTYVENDQLKYEILTGLDKIKSKSITQVSGSTSAHIDLSFENTPKYTIILNKKDTENNSLKDVKFSITGENYDQNMYTNKNGILTIQDLEAGVEYTLTEESTYGYYPISPIKFKLVNNNGTLSFTVLSGSFDSNAIITESTATKGILAEDTVEVSLTNTKIKTYNLQLIKYAKGKETTLSGAQYKIEGDGIKSTGIYKTTDSNGQITFEGLHEYVTGTTATCEYTITEITPPQGYKLISEPIKVRYNNGTLEIISGTIKGQVVVGNGTVKIEVEDEPLFKLSKVDQQSKEPIPGAKFAIYEINADKTEVGFGKDLKGNYVGTEETIDGKTYRILTTDENGEISVELKIGLYKAIEIQPAKGYELESDIEKRTTYFEIKQSKERTEEFKQIFEKKDSSTDGSYEFDKVVKVEDGIVALSEWGQIVKYDFFGNKIWESELSENNGVYYGITAIKDGIIVVADKSVIRFDSNGKQVWRNDELGGYSFVIQTKENELITLGTIGSSNKAKIDLDGNFIDEIEDERAYFAATVVPNGFIAFHDSGAIKYDLDGNQVWENREIEGIWYGAVTVEDGVIAVGDDLNNKGIIIKYDFDGNIEWKIEKDYQIFRSIADVEDGILVIDSGYIAKYNLDGNLEWEKSSNDIYDVNIITVPDGIMGVADSTIVKYGMVETSAEVAPEQSFTVENKYIGIAGDVIVHHYIQGTTTQVPSKNGEVVADERITGNIGETYTTKASSDIATNYEYVSKTANSTGTITSDTIEVTYYYKMKDGTIKNGGITKTGAKVIDIDDAKSAVSYKIDYTVTVADYKGSTKITLVDKLTQPIDEAKSDLAGGKYDATNKTITWEETQDIDTLNTEKVLSISKTIKIVYASISGESITNQANGTIKLEGTNQEETKQTEHITLVDNHISVAIIKVWDDNNNASGKRPESIKLLVKNGDQTVADKEVTEAENWKYTFTLPKYNSQGNEITYTVDEAEINANDLKFYTKTISGTTITNAFKVPEETMVITVNKVWDDNENANGKRPESIRLQVKNGQTVVQETTVTEAENWAHTFTLPKYDSQGNEVAYTVDEAEVKANDLMFYTKEINGTIITNTFAVPGETTEVTVSKVWNDNNNANGKRPESIKLLVKNGDQTVADKEVTEAENWTHTFTLPKYNNQGNEIAYTVDEAEVKADDLKFYAKEVNGTTVANTFTVPGETTEVTVSKVWNDNNNTNGKRPASIKLQVKNGNQTVADKEVTEAENWAHTFTLPKYNSQGNEIAYTVDEAEVNTNDLMFYTKTISGTTVTNTFTVPGETTEVTVSKVWNDNNNANGKRPTSIKLQVKNGNKTVGEQVVTEAENWKHTFTLPKYDSQGNEITYTVDEAEVNVNDLMFYTKEINGTKITNTFTVPNDTINVTINKVWNDNRNVNNKRPISIKLQVKNGQTVVQEAKVTEAENWKYTFTNLPKYDNHGNEIIYTVDEAEVNANDLMFYTKEINENTITNTFAVPEDTTSVTVKKVWNDNEDENSKRPESIELQVKNGDMVVGSATVTEAENWKYTFTDLPKYNEHGDEIEYTVDEKEVKTNDLMFYTKAINGTTITNTFTVPENKTTIMVNKEWQDNNNIYGKRPSAIKVQIKNGQTVVQEATLTDNDNWRHTFTNLAKYDARGNEIQYTIDEEEVNANDLKFYTKEINGTTIKNTFTVPNDTVDITVNKTWEDNNNVNGKRPISIKLQVKNGRILIEEAVVTAQDNWKYTFRDLPKYDSQGKEIAYTVDEEEVNTNDLMFYTKEINGTTITNTFTVPTDEIRVTVSKEWNDSNNANKKRPTAIKLQVKNGNSIVEEIVVTERENWKHTFTLPKYDSQGNEITYTVDETEINANDLKFYTKEINGTTIINTFLVPSDTINVTVNKVWNDNDNANGKRPNSIKLQVKNGNQTVVEQMVSETENWTHTFTLPKYDRQGNEITYTIDEEEVNANDLMFYTKEVNGTTVTNTFTVPGETTAVTVSKVWNDNDNASGKRPESIILQVKNGDEVVASKEVSENDNWQYTFNLPKYDAQGNEITYVADETEVNKGDLKFYVKEVKGTEITNTFKVPDDKITIKVIKVWNDNNDEKESRPESIRIQVRKENFVVEEMKISADSNWEHTFENLPKYDKNGDEIEYTVREAEVKLGDLKKYDIAISKMVGVNNKEVTITNTYNYGRVIIKYVDKETKEEILVEEKEGKIGEDYNIKEKEIKGYKFIGKSNNTAGKLGKDDITVKFYYEKEKEPVKPAEPDLPNTGSTYLVVVLIISITIYLVVITVRYKKYLAKEEKN